MMTKGIGFEVEVLYFQSYPAYVSMKCQQLGSNCTLLCHHTSFALCACYGLLFSTGFEDGFSSTSNRLKALIKGCQRQKPISQTLSISIQHN